MAAGNDTDIEAEEVKGRMSYSVDEAPFPLLWPLFGMQHIVILIGTMVAITTFTAIQLGAGDQPEVRTQLLSITLFSCGLATVLQTILGSRLPVMHGPAGEPLAAIAAILSLGKWSDEALLQQIDANGTTVTDELWKIRMREIQGNLMLASATQFVLGATGIIGFLLVFIGPMTVAPTVIITGIYIGQFAIPLCELHWGIAFLSMALVVIFALFLSKTTLPLPTCSRTHGCIVKRFSVFQLIPFLLAICITWLLTYVLTVTDTLPSNSTQHGHLARTDVRLKAIHEAPWFYFPLPFQFGMPTVSVAGYLALMASTLSAIIKCMGDFMATARVAEVVPPVPHAVNRGITVIGFTTAVTAMIGQLCHAFPFTETIGALAVTKTRAVTAAQEKLTAFPALERFGKIVLSRISRWIFWKERSFQTLPGLVPSRKVFVTAGILMILAGVIGKVGAVFTIIPDPAIGGVTLAAMSMVAASGMAVLQHIELNSSRNLLIIGISVMLGLKLPEWMTLHPDVVKSGNVDFDQIVTVLLSNPTFVGGFLACLLDNIVPGTEKERGIKSWRKALDKSGIQYKTREDTYELTYITPMIRKVKCCSYFPVSPTFDKDIHCRSCCSKASNRAAYAMDNIVDLNETHEQKE